MPKPDTTRHPPKPRHRTPAARRTFRPAEPFPAVSLVLVLIAIAGHPAAAQLPSDSALPSDSPLPSRAEVATALRRATAFYHGRVASHGGYVYQYSSDLTLREGEGIAPLDTVWVQPPGTPAVGMAYLDAYAATGEPQHLHAARDAGTCLRLGQLQSGGWSYRIDFDPARRSQFSYRLGLDAGRLPDAVPTAVRQSAAGWDEWKRRKFKGNLTILDDDTTQAALRFLVRLDAALGFQDEPIHEAATLGLAALRGAQYPNGAWSASFDRFPAVPPSPVAYPLKPATLPTDWPRDWPKDFTGCYVTNDDLIATAIDTLLLAHTIYGDPRDLAAAERAGDFLILAQLPAPQPAWAQQYDRDMQPVWSRAFEPPAISGGESQRILQALLALHRATGQQKFLEPIEPALAYLQRSRRPDGTLARFYELNTNRPIYFTRGPGGRDLLTYDDARPADHYSFIIACRLDAISAAYRRQTAPGPPPQRGAAAQLAAEVQTVLASQDDRGAWATPGRMRHHKVSPPGGVIDSETFVRNVALLCRSLAALP